MNVFLVANSLAPITTFEGIRIMPDYNYLEGDLLVIDILVVPSAEHHMDSDLEYEEMLDFVIRVDQQATFMTSHCDGAFVLAKSGLLDQVVTTTFPADIEAYKKMFPQLDVWSNVIFVRDGKYITSAGGARSFDGALYLCEVLYGPQIARSLAKGLMLDWNLEKVPKVIIVNQ